jgi:hypothetical protein
VFDLACSDCSGGNNPSFAMSERTDTTKIPSALVASCCLRPHRYGRTHLFSAFLDLRLENLVYTIQEHSLVLISPALSLFRTSTFRVAPSTSRYFLRVARTFSPTLIGAILNNAYIPYNACRVARCPQKKRIRGFSRRKSLVDFTVLRTGGGGRGIVSVFLFFCACLVVWVGWSRTSTPPAAFRQGSALRKWNRIGWGWELDLGWKGNC